MFCLLGIDAGTSKSGVVVFDTYYWHVDYSGEIENNVLLSYLRHGLIQTCNAISVADKGIFLEKVQVGNYFDVCLIETIEAMGKRVGREIFETAIWIGRFQEACEGVLNKKVFLVSRKSEKRILGVKRSVKNTKTGKPISADSQIRSSILKKFDPSGGGNVPQIGTKKEPGPLYGVTGHAWSALAVVLAGLEIYSDELETILV